MRRRCAGGSGKYSKAKKSSRSAIRSMGTTALWASTGKENPVYSDVPYIEELVGPVTVNTIPLDTSIMDALAATTVLEKLARGRKPASRLPSWRRFECDNRQAPGGRCRVFR